VDLQVPPLEYIRQFLADGFEDANPQEPLDALGYPSGQSIFHR
jgi:hypothetical protein